MSKETEKTAQQGARYAALATQLPFTVLAGYWLGYWLDSFFETTWLRILFLFIAIVGGIGQILAQALRNAKKP